MDVHRAAGEVIPEFVEGRKRPLGYLCTVLGSPSTPMYVPGHYETPCGGCDTIKTIADVYGLVKRAARAGYDVLFEGIMFQDGRVSEFVEFNLEFPTVVIGLTTPIEDCLLGINARRQEKGDSRELNPKNTIERMERVKRNLTKLQNAGVRVLRLSRQEALDACLREFGWVRGTDSGVLTAAANAF